MTPGATGFVPRMRSAMEAADLGLSLLQAHWRPVAAVWALQLALVLGLLLPFLHGNPLWILLVLGWIKPWLDRGPLFVLSRAVFGQPAGLWDFLGAWRSVHRRGLAAGLLWRRFSPLRSYVLPVFQLENLGGAAFRARGRVLTRQGGGTAFLLAGAGWAFTLILFFGALGLLQGMLPPGVRAQVWHGFTAPTPGFRWLLLAVGLLALTLTEPFYVAAGFGLYLNRRTHLEGWDLELAFRRLAARLALGVLLVLAAHPLRAQGPVREGPSASQAAPLPEEGPLRPEAEGRQRVLRILKEDPAFRHTRQVRTLTYAPTGREPRWLRRLLDGIFADRKPDPAARASSKRPVPEGLWEAIALIGKILLVGGLLTLLLWLVYRFRHRLGLPEAKAGTWEAPEALAGLDIRPESLPADVPGSARARFLRGEPRAALALLYRGALAGLVHRHGLEIPASATEGDCLRAARLRLDPAAAGTFQSLTDRWQRLAYKEEVPTLESFESLCEAWPSAFGGLR